MTRSTVLRTLAALIGALAGYYFVLIIWALAAPVQFLTTDYAGSGGIGAVSVGTSELSLIGLLPATLAGRLLAPWARRSASWIRWLHRLHTLALIYIVVAGVVIVVSALTGAWQPQGIVPGMIIASLAIFFVGQFGLIAALLILFAITPHRLLAAH